LGITFKPIRGTVVDCQLVQCVLGNMAERRMAEIVSERRGLDHIRIDAAEPRHPSRVQVAQTLC
jgi:hypothetical protein